VVHCATFFVMDSKPKRKRASKPGLNIESTIPLSLEECAIQLQDFDEPGFFNATSVRLDQIDEHTWRFVIDRLRMPASIRGKYSHGSVWYLKVRCEGYLQLASYNSTLVIGSARTHLLTVFINSIWFLVFGPAALIFATKVGNLWLCPSVMFLGLIYMSFFFPLAVGKKYARLLAEDIRVTLLAEARAKQKKGQTRRPI